MLQPSRAQANLKPALKSTFPQKDVWNVIVAQVESPDEIYIRFADDEELVEISNSLKKFYSGKSLPPVLDPKEGEVYLFEEGGKLFRAQVEFNDDGLFLLQPDGVSKY